MPRKRYLTPEEAIQRLSEDDTYDHEQSDIDIVVFPPEIAEAGGEEEGNDNILNHDNDDLPWDTAGYHSLPQEEIYWSLDKDISVPTVRDSMSRLQYKNMKQNLHLAYNSQINNIYRLYKVRPYLNLLNREFQQFGIFSHDLSIDEQMIPYRGKYSAFCREAFHV
ncbi:hypothetical protein AVEN_59167-1 [Araneus ventricosus]|uniref:PiggyBac transposable element-derived protein domain-containing protein n=1 Tax=Araneus ventricosus TaxID=182803 RepID=A0A4Y2IRV3_ARAVE|nr:hypothetical protein AVEN_59167-1 [Araneus ventricosus]